MRLRITYAPWSDESMETGFRVTATLRGDNGSALEGVPGQLRVMPLEKLAERWWLVQGHDPREDANALLCADCPKWNEAILDDLMVRSYELRSVDAITVVAVVERVKRAAWMAFQSSLYMRFLDDATSHGEEVIRFSLDSDKQPGGTPLPALPKSIIDRANSG